MRDTGVAQRSDWGLSRSEFAAAVSAGRLLRIAQGWYATPQADPDTVRALRLGGRLCCLSALPAEMWVPRDGRLHVAVRKSDPAPTVSGVTVHRLRSEGWGSSEAALPLETNLHLALRHHSVEVGLTVVESAVEQGLLTPMAAARLVEGQTSRRYHSGLRHFDPRSGSGSETRVRLWFQRRNVRVRSQVHIAGVGRIDLLVGESLVIEVDSAAFHTGRDRYEEDRRRDLTLTALGFQVVRLAYAQVFASWPTTVVLLKQVLGSGRYRLPPSPDALLHLPELRRLAA